MNEDIRETITCKLCGKDRRYYKSENAHFCSITCYRKSLLGKKQSVEHIEKRRVSMSKIKRTDEWKNNISKGLKGFKHSPAFSAMISKRNKQRKASLETRNLMASLHKGELSTFWKGGISFINKDARKVPEYREWRRKVFFRDNFICQKCGERGKKLAAHHIESFATNPSLRLEESNGMTLCWNCHECFHNKYGKITSRKEMQEYIDERDRKKE